MTKEQLIFYYKAMLESNNESLENATMKNNANDENYYRGCVFWLEDIVKELERLD